MIFFFRKLNYCREARRSRAEWHVFATLLMVKCLFVCLFVSLFVCMFVCLYFRTSEILIRKKNSIQNLEDPKIDPSTSRCLGSWVNAYTIHPSFSVFLPVLPPRYWWSNVCWFVCISAQMKINWKWKSVWKKVLPVGINPYTWGSVWIMCTTNLTT